MKVAQVIGRLHGGGAQRAAWNVALALRDAGAGSYMLALREGGAFVDGEAGTVDVRVLAIDRGRLRSIFVGLWRLRAWVKQQQIEVLHVHGAECLPVCAIAICGLRRRPALVFTWHDSDKVLEQRGVRRWMLLWAIGQCRDLTGSSQDVADRLARGLGGRRIVGVLRNAVPAQARSRQDLAEVPVILWMGRFGPIKAPANLIRAAGRLRGAGYRFRIVILGDATEKMRWYRQQMEQLIEDLHLGDCIDLDGWVTDMKPYLEMADIAVQSSRSEGLSMALLEQMMSGLAILATDVGDTRLALADGACGVLVPPDDIEALTTALRRLLDDPKLRKHLGEAACQRAQREYSLASLGKRMLDSYEAVLAP